MVKAVIKAFLGFTLYNFIAVAQTPHEPEFCTEKELEVFFLFEVTNTFEPGFENMRSQTRRAIDSIRATLPNTRFGIGTFSDKPIRPFGMTNDHCFMLWTDLTSDIGLIQIGLNDIVIKHGGDPLNSQMDAMFYSLVSPDISWTNTALINGKEAIRILVLITGSRFHTYNHLHTLVAHPGTTDVKCANHDYVKKMYVWYAFQTRGARPLFLATNEVADVWRSRVERMKRGGIAYLDLQLDMSNLYDYITRGVAEVMCQEKPAFNLKFTPIEGVEMTTPYLDSVPPDEGGEPPPDDVADDDDDELEEYEELPKPPTDDFVYDDDKREVENKEGEEDEESKRGKGPTKQMSKEAEGGGSSKVIIASSIAGAVVVLFGVGACGGFLCIRKPVYDAFAETADDPSAIDPMKRDLKVQLEQTLFS